MKYSTKIELETYLSSKWNLPRSSNLENKKWSYNTTLTVSPNFLINKKVRVKGVEKYINDVKFSYYGKLILYFNDNSIGNLTNTFLIIINPITEIKSIIQLHPGRKGKTLWSKGYYLEENLFKSMYYETNEYREKYEHSLNSTFNTTGVKSPIQIPSIKQKIFNSIQEKFGVATFLNRGHHYSAITQTMIDKYGVSNLFNDPEWQQINSESNKKCIYGSSESEFVNIISKKFSLSTKDYFGHGSLFGRKSFKINNNLYVVDMYIPKFNLILEFYGDYWHCNPEKYNRNYFHVHKQLTSQEVWNYDRIRIQEIINHTNVNVLVIWESDWKKNKIQQISHINTLINFNKA